MQNIQVSIITPTYNSAKYVAETIESVLAQTYQDWEMLITDDCSTDNTWEILSEYANKDARIKIFRLDKNGGAGVARNNSIKQAKGRFITFIDSDDLWHPNKLERQVSFMLEHNIPLSFCSYTLFDDIVDNKGQVTAPKRVNYSKELKCNYIGCSTAMYDLTLVDKHFFPSMRKNEDWAMWLDLLKKIEYGHGLQESLIKYRIGHESVSSSKLPLLKYNWHIYRNIEGFNLIKSLCYFIRFFFYYFAKKYRT